MDAPALLLPLLAILGSSCAVAKRPVKLPPEDGVATAMLVTGALGPPMEKLARHPWFAIREQGVQQWERWEIGSRGSTDLGYVNHSYRDPLGGDEVRVHGVLRGEKAMRFIRCLRRESVRYEHRHVYRVWPGPNSNTYADIMLRRCGFRAELPPTSVGKDYRGIIGVSGTTGGTGVQLETPILGVRVGLTEGVQFHVFSFTVGIDWWPPAIVFPVGDGRLGFADR